MQDTELCIMNSIENMQCNMQCKFSNTEKNIMFCKHTIYKYKIYKDFNVLHSEKKYLTVTL